MSKTSIRLIFDWYSTDLLLIKDLYMPDIGLTRLIPIYVYSFCLMIINSHWSCLRVFLGLRSVLTFASKYLLKTRAGELPRSASSHFWSSHQNLILHHPYIEGSFQSFFPFLKTCPFSRHLEIQFWNVPIFRPNFTNSTSLRLANLLPYLSLSF